MKKCPFHADSQVEEQDGDIHRVHCRACGDYRISGVALDQLQKRRKAPRGWSKVLSHRAVISTRDMRDSATA